MFADWNLYFSFADIFQRPEEDLGRRPNVTPSAKQEKTHPKSPNGHTSKKKNLLYSYYIKIQEGGDNTLKLKRLPEVRRSQITPPLKCR